MRILVAPYEIGGQMQLLASTFRKLGHEATSVSYYEPTWTGHASDLNLGFRSRGGYAARSLRMAAFALQAARAYDVFHFFYGRSLLNKCHLDLSLLKRLGKKVFVHFRGSDIRSRGYLESRDGGTEANTPSPAIQTERQRRLVRTWQKHADAVFVSTPDLLELAPGSRLVPQAIDLEAWPFVGSDAHAAVVKVAHAPTRRPVKGTDHVIAAVHHLQEKGVPVELVLVEKVPHEQVLSLYSSCHIAVDQLLVGWYGNFSIEMMALGKPVLCCINPSLLHHRPDLPIVNATVESIADAIQEVATGRERWLEMGEKGRAYVEEHHAAATVCNRLLTIYRET